MIGLFANDEERDTVISLDVVKVVDVGSDKLEDEHNIVSSVQINLLVSLNRLANLLFFLIFLKKLLHINFSCRLGNDLFLAFSLLHLPLLGIDIVIIYLDVFFIELLIVFEVDS